MPGTSSMAASSVQDGHQAKAVGFSAANALTQHLPERFRVGHLQGALIGHRQQCDRPLSVLPEVTGLFPGHLKSALRQGKAVLPGLLQQPLFLLRFQIAGLQAPRASGSAGSFRARVGFAVRRNCQQLPEVTRSSSGS